MPAPKKSKIRTLNDLTGSNLNSGEGRQHESAYHKALNSISISNNKSSQPSSLGKATIMTFDSLRVAHIPTLPSADSAKAMLERVCKEFEPIVKRRGYNVKSVSEMCCCFDGLDFTPKTGERSKGRKCRVMAHNVWGYNQTMTRGRYKSHTVHLRLRHPRSHDRLLLYEDVAGTMAHELAHCEIGPHNDAFNKLMDEILEEHMLLQSQSFGTPREGTVSGLAGNLAFFPGEGSALGGGDKNGNTPFTNNPRNNTPGYKLGGDISFTKWMSPAQAACMAAEARRRQQKLRLRGQHCCKPCTITIPDSDDEGEENDAVIDKKPAAKKRNTPANATPVSAKNSQATGKQPAVKRAGRNKKPKTEVSSRGVAVAFIDLTEDVDPVAVHRTENDWSCNQCTYINQAMALACSMCTKAKA